MPTATSDRGALSRRRPPLVGIGGGRKLAGALS
jgi:hypothetical protein